MEIRRRLQIPPRKVVLFSVANLALRMGLENLVIAIKAAVKTAPDIYLVLGGDWPLRDDLVTLTKRLGAALNIDNYQNVKENPENWREISPQCGKFVVSNCSLEKNVDSLEKCLQKSWKEQSYERNTHFII